jgi:hypothetical protein
LFVWGEGTSITTTSIAASYAPRAVLRKYLFHCLQKNNLKLQIVIVVVIAALLIAAVFYHTHHPVAIGTTTIVYE